MGEPIIKFEAMSGATAMSDDLQSETTMYVEKIRALTRWLANEASNRGDLRTKWFGSRNPPKVVLMLANLDAYLNKRCTRLTFVMENSSSYGAVWPSRVISESPDNYRMGGVMTTDNIGKFENEMWGDELVSETDEDFQKAGGYLKVPSGLRIYLGTKYVSPSVSSGSDGLATLVTYRVNTIFHEMTHKIVKTKDHPKPSGSGKCYGYNTCKSLAITHPDLAITNADNWGFFMAEVYKTEGYGS